MKDVKLWKSLEENKIENKQLKKDVKNLTKLIEKMSTNKPVEILESQLEVKNVYEAKFPGNEIKQVEVKNAEIKTDNVTVGTLDNILSTNVVNDKLTVDGTVEVKNQIDISQVVQSTKEITDVLNNLIKTVKESESIKTSEIKDLIKKIQKTNKKDLNIKKASQKVVISGIDLEADKNKYIPVRLTDGEKWLKAIARTVAGGGGTQLKPIDYYVISDIDDGNNDYNYYGYLRDDGWWYIMKEDVVNKTYRYVKGGSDYATNWGNRSTLSYNYYNEVF